MRPLTEREQTVVVEFSDPGHQKRLSARRTEFVNQIQSALAGLEMPGLEVKDRIKEAHSFARKACKAISNDDGNDSAKYSDPFTQIEDQIGIRILVHYREDVQEITRILRREMFCCEIANKGGQGQSQRLDRVGYESVHIVVMNAKQDQPEYDGLHGEIQVRTHLQHVWAEIEHDMRYKTGKVASAEIHRRFALLAAQLESADREFSRINNDFKDLPNADAPDGGAFLTPQVVVATVASCMPNLGEELNDLSASTIVELCALLQIESDKQLTAVLTTIDQEILDEIFFEAYSGKLLARGPERRVVEALMVQNIDECKALVRQGRFRLLGADNERLAYWRLNKLSEYKIPER